MRIATYEGEGMGDLVSRVFSISGRGAEARAREAEAALREANPHLRDLRRVPKGTPVVVPDLPGVKPTDEARAVGGDARALLATMHAALGPVERSLDDAARRASDAATRDLALLRAKEVRELAASERGLGRKVKDLARDGERRRDAARALRAAQVEAMGQLRSDLDEFLRLHGG